MSAQAQVSVSGEATTVHMAPKVSRRGTTGFWGQARLHTAEGTYVVQVSAWLAGSGNGNGNGGGNGGGQ